MFLAALGILCVLPGCLNPLPDDQPSYRSVAPPSVDDPGPAFGEGEEMGDGAGMTPQSPSIEGEGPPSANPDDLLPGAEPGPDAGAPDAGVGAGAEDDVPTADTLQ